MKIRRFYGKDMRDALKQVKDELGGEAVIMSNKKHADGIEIVAAYDQEPSLQTTLANTNKQHSGSRSTNSSRPTPTLSEIIGDSGPDSLKALLEKQSKSQVQQAEVKPPAPSFTKPNHTRSEHAQHVLSQDDAMSDVRQELASLRDILQFQVAGLLKQDRQQKHPQQTYLASRLESMGVSSQLAHEMVSYAPREQDERQAWLFVLTLLANRLQASQDDILLDGGVVALMGATGTGKTTTIAKLAAQAAAKYGADEVALITTDSYRIAAFEQIATYGRIIGCAVKKAHNAVELSELLQQYRNKRLVLIDTAGFGQRDARLIKQLEALQQSGFTEIKKYLVLPANAQRRVLEETVKTYSKISLAGCVLTKIDECYSLGEVISVAIEHRLALSYLTDGQRVPEDLRKADAKFLVSSAAKLYKKYGLTHTTGNNLNTAVAV